MKAAAPAAPFVATVARCHPDEIARELRLGAAVAPLVRVVMSAPEALALARRIEAPPVRLVMVEGRGASAWDLWAAAAVLTLWTFALLVDAAGDVALWLLGVW